MSGNWRFLLLLWLINLTYGEWVHDNRCLDDDPTPALQRLLPPNQLLLKVIHICSKEEIAPFSQPSPKAVRWSFESNNAKEMWHSIIRDMTGKKLILVGDSLMYQTLIGLLIYFDSIGINCTRVEPSHTKYHCGSMEIDRPVIVRKLTDEYLPLVLPHILNADIVILNVGLHYDSNVVCNDVRTFFTQLHENITHKLTNVQVAWLDTYRPHFPSPGGSYLAWKINGSTIETKFPACGKISEPISYDYHIYDSSHLIAHEFPNIPVITTYDLVYDRYDIHLGALTHGDPAKLDCVHLCTRLCYWEAISFRIGKKIDHLVKKIKDHEMK